VNASKQNGQIRVVVVEPGVVGGGHWIQANKELVNLRPFPCSVGVLQVQDPHVAKGLILCMPPKDDERRVIGLRIAGDHASASPGWRPQLSPDISDLQPLVDSRIIFPCVFEVICCI